LGSAGGQAWRPSRSLRVTASCAQAEEILTFRVRHLPALQDDVCEHDRLKANWADWRRRGHGGPHFRQGKVSSVRHGARRWPTPNCGFTVGRRVLRPLQYASWVPDARSNEDKVLRLAALDPRQIRLPRIRGGCRVPDSRHGGAAWKRTSPAFAFPLSFHPLESSARAQSGVC
jgi:hypothetical protein